MSLAKGRYLHVASHPVLHLFGYSLTLVNNRILLFGGIYVGPKHREPFAGNYFYEYNLSLDKWVSLVDLNTPTVAPLLDKSVLPSKRACHSAVAYSSKLLLFGGSGWNSIGKQKYHCDDCWTFDTNTNTWELFAKNPFAQLTGHSAVIHNDEMIVLGGEVGGNSIINASCNTIYILNLKSKQWRRIDSNNSNQSPKDLPNFYYHSATVVNTNEGAKMVVIGGYQSYPIVFACNPMTIVDEKRPEPTVVWMYSLENLNNDNNKSKIKNNNSSSWSVHSSLINLKSRVNHAAVI